MGANNSNSDNYNGVIGYTHTFGASKFFELRAATTATTRTSSPRTSGSKNNELGIPNGNLAAYPETSGSRASALGLRQYRLAGHHQRERVGTTYNSRATSPGSATSTPSSSAATCASCRGAVSNPQTQPQGRFTFDRNYTSNTRRANTGDAFASFLLGYPNLVQRDIVDTWPMIHRNFLGVFVQDDLRVNRKLSLQLGLRWDLMTPPVHGENSSRTSARATA
jgi:hypothetical protein